MDGKGLFEFGGVGYRFTDNLWRSQTAYEAAAVLLQKLGCVDLDI